jgi:hypothetical protein
MSFKMDCPHCMKTLNVTEKAMGKTVPCPGCNQPVTIPPKSPLLHPTRQVEPNGYPTPVAQASQAASPQMPLVPPGSPQVSQAESTESETGTCAFCCKPMPSDAVQCSSCGNWRHDIHQLIDDYRRLAIAQVNALIIGILLTTFSFIAAAVGATTYTMFGKSFSFEKFVATPWFVIGVLIAVAVVLVYVITQARAGRIKHRIHEVSKGLWKRPWWAS